MSKIFWKNKKILITGINGFVGSNLAKELIFLKANVSGIILNKKKNSLLYFEGINKKCKLYNGDISNYKFVKKIFDKNKFDIVFHLAAQVEVGVANNNPFNTWESNIKGTYNLLDIINKHKNVRSVIVASSDKAYGSYPKKLLPYKEDYKSAAVYPYDVSKACADMIAKAYSSKLFNLPVIITRFSNIYGPGQLHFSALIPDLMSSIIKNTKFVPRGNGMDIRDYIYVKDIVDVYLLISFKLFKNPELKGEVFNAGNNKPKTIKSIIKEIYNYKNQKTKLREILKIMKNKKTVGEIKYQYMDYSKLYKYFKWKPKYKFKDTVPILFKWYGDYFKNIGNKN